MNNENIENNENIVYEKYTKQQRKKDVFKHFTKQGMSNKKGKAARKLVRATIRKGLETGRL